LEKGYYIVNIDKKTYAARTDLDFDSNPNYELVEKDICELEHLPVNIDYIINFAAESHVDNSITANKIFLDSNIY
jgi:dTDP-glucose 4,6-dehydratase